MSWQNHLRAADCEVPDAVSDACDNQPHTGWALLAYASIVYPLLGQLLGHGYPAMPMFGITPCPVTIFTFALCLLTTEPVPRRLLGRSHRAAAGAPRAWRHRSVRPRRRAWRFERAGPDSPPPVLPTADQRPLFKYMRGDQVLFSRPDGATPPDQTSLVCGFFGCDARPFNPLLASLPSLVHIRAPDDGEDSWLEQFIRFAALETDRQRPGSEAVLERPSEMMTVDQFPWDRAQLESTCQRIRHQGSLHFAMTALSD